MADQRDKLNGSNPFHRPNMQEATEAMVEDASRDIAALAVRNGKIAAGRIHLTAVGFQAPLDYTRQEFERLGEVLLTVQTGLAWAIGDLFALGERMKWGETCAALAATYHLEVDTIYRYKALAERVPFGIRNPELSPAHHRLVAYMESDHQSVWLQYAVQKKWDVATMQLAISQNNPNPTPLSKPRLYSVEYFEREFNDLEQKVIKGKSKVGESDRWVLISKVRRILELLES
jgi:hypothetical protein